jgi:hypothetical protein
MRHLWEVADFVRTMRRRMRFGELSRARLRLLRLQLRGGVVELDWTLRLADIWDASLQRHQRDSNVSQQALRDAIKLRELLFDALPEVESAVLQAFRQSEPREPPELVILGSLSRSDPTVLRVGSLAMQAKLYGFRFDLDNGVLQPLQVEQLVVPEVTNEFQVDEVTL